MTKMKVGLAAALGAMVGCAKVTTDEVVVVPTRAVIVAEGRGASAAANELALHLKEITGVAVPVEKAAAQGQFVFRVTDGNPNDESYAWTVTDGGVDFSGVAKFAVYDFLERALGVRWPAEDIIAIAARNPLVLKKTSVSGAPEVNIRCIRYESSRMGPQNAAFMRRMRMGRHDEPKYGHAFTGYWKKYGKNHRDYFAMRKDGIRGPSNAKPEDLLGNVAVYAANTGSTLAMCCTSTGLVARIVKNWIGEGKPAYINICENDVPGQNSCHCPSCEALDVKPPKVNPQWMTYYADRYVHFGNQVLKAARVYRPDVRVCYYAYNATQDAPKRERPDESSVIGLVPTVFTHRFIEDYVGQWTAMGAKHYFYRPNRHHYFIAPYLPVGSERHFYEIYQYIREQGSIGFDYDSPSRTGFFQWFQDYVLGHALFDPSKSFEYWESHYFDAFGAGKADAMAYYRYWRTQVWDKRLEPNLDEITRKGKWFNFGRGLMQNLKDYYTAADFAATEPYVAAVEAKATTESEKRLAKELRRAHDHAKIFFETLTNKTKANTEKLIAFRKANGLPLYTWAEQYFGDVTGVEGLLGKEKKKSGK